MKKIVFQISVALLFVSCHPSNTNPYNNYFKEGTLRIDYFHSGDAKSETVTIDQLYSYPIWAGSCVNLVDTLNYGSYYYKIYDKEGETLLYSKGFDSYFKEYQMSDPALEGISKEFHETAMIPMPKNPVVFVLEKRIPEGTFKEVYRGNIDPLEAKEPPSDPEVLVYENQIHGIPTLKADVAIIGEGYSRDEVEKFQNDLERFTEYFFRAEPCKSNRDLFNIRGVLKPSEDSGIDEPRAGIDKNTSIGATFNSLGSERYVLTEDNKALRDIAGNVPYDALYIMVNHSRYGGGGIYNFYCTYTSDNIYSDYLMVHEFGHSFFGLADEYYTSSTSYTDFYSPDYEPAEPNITALKDPENIKWKHLLSKDIEIPTMWPKQLFDSLDLIWQAKRVELNDRIAEMQKNGSPKELVDSAKADYDRQIQIREKDAQAFLQESEFSGKVGAFEGAGYASTGLYRPSINCIMFTRTNYFCPVCQDAMLHVIETYTK